MKSEIELLENHLKRLVSLFDNEVGVEAGMLISKEIRETAGTINRMKDRRRDRYPARRNPYLPDPFTYTGEGPGNRNNA